MTVNAGRKKRGRPRKNPQLHICVDMGNGTWLLGYIERDGHQVTAVDPDGLNATPAAIGFEDGQPDKPLFGRAALNYQKMCPEWVCCMLKRARGQSDCVALIDTTGKEWSFAELETMLLKWRVSHLEKTTGLTVNGILATVPANYSDAERRGTIAVIEAANFKSLGVINEPTAAALAYAVGNDGDYTSCIVDIGCGTTDDTILQVKNGSEFTVRASVGRNDLAGEEMTDALYEHAAREAAKRGAPLDPEKSLRDCTIARVECESAKRDLSTQQVVDLVLRSGNQLVDTRVTRELFAELCAPLITDIVALSQEALQRAQATPDTVDRVLLVGGGSRAYGVHEALTKVFGAEKVCRDNDPETAVVRGGALAIGMKIQERVAQGDTTLEGEAARYQLAGSITIHDITAHDVGVLALKRTTGEDVLAPITQRGAMLPTSAACTFGLTNGGAGNVDTTISILEGDSQKPPGEANVLASFPLTGLPAGPEDDRIEVSINISQDGAIDVTARDTHSGQEIAETLEAKAATQDTTPQ